MLRTLLKIDPLCCSFVPFTLSFSLISASACSKVKSSLYFFNNFYKKKSTQDLHGGEPLLVSGKLAKSNKIVKASTKRLKAKVHNTAKSSTNYKIRKPNGKVYRGKRKSAPVFYGYHLNKGFVTASDSLIPNKRVPQRDFTSKTVDTLFKNPKYIKARNKFAKNLEKSMEMASK